MAQVCSACASVDLRDATGKSGAMTGAAPATVSGKSAATATGSDRSGWEGAAGDDPEPGDLRIAANWTIPRAEERDQCRCQARGDRAYLGHLGVGRRPVGQEPLCRAARSKPAAAQRHLSAPRPKRGDAEMAERIAAHRARRGAFWCTVETPLELVPTIAAEATSERPVLVDCLTLWLSNLLMAGRQPDTEVVSAVPSFAPGRSAGRAGQQTRSGWGSFPRPRSAAIFATPAGRLNQEVAALADRVVFIAAGLPLLH